MMVQTTSTAVLSWKVDGVTPRDFRCLTMLMAMAPNTPTATTHMIQKASMCMSQTLWLMSVTPFGMFRSQAASAGTEAAAATRPARALAMRFVLVIGIGKL